MAVLSLLLSSEAGGKGECFKKKGWLANFSENPSNTAVYIRSQHSLATITTRSHWTKTDQLCVYLGLFCEILLCRILNISFGSVFFVVVDHFMFLYS